jgi:hypothetical protein
MNIEKSRYRPFRGIGGLFLGVFVVFSCGCLGRVAESHEVAFNVPDNYSVFSSSRDSDMASSSRTTCNLTIVNGEVVSAIQEGYGGSFSGGSGYSCRFSKTTGPIGECMRAYQGVANESNCSCDVDYCITEGYLSNSTLGEMANLNGLDSTVDNCLRWNKTDYNRGVVCSFQGQISAYHEWGYRNEHVWVRADLQPELCNRKSAPEEYVRGYCNQSKYLDY